MIIIVQLHFDEVRYGYTIRILFLLLHFFSSSFGISICRIIRMMRNVVVHNMCAMVILYVACFPFLPLFFQFSIFIATNISYYKLYLPEMVNNSRFFNSDFYFQIFGIKRNRNNSAKGNTHTHLPYIIYHKDATCIMYIYRVN